MSTELTGAGRAQLQVPNRVASAPRPVRIDPGTREALTQGPINSPSTAPPGTAPPGTAPPGAAPLGSGPQEADSSSEAVEGLSRAVDRETLDKAVASVKEFIESTNRQLDFKVDEETGRTLVRVIDPDSGDLIRQLPPEELIAVAEVLEQLGSQKEARSANGGLSGLLLRAEA